MVALILCYLVTLYPLYSLSLIPLAPSDLKDGNFLLGCILFVLNGFLSIAAFTVIIIRVIDLSYTLEVLFYVSVYLNTLCSVKLVGKPLSCFSLF